MENYKPNSNRFKEEQKKETSKKNVQKVITGSAKIKKKSETRKFADLFLPEDVSSVKSYIVMDIVLPAIKSIVSDTVNAFLYPNGGAPKKNGASRVSYSRYYNDRNDRREPVSRTRNNFDYDDILFDSRGDAEAVLSSMDDIISQYGVVSVGDLYDLAEISTHNYMVNNYGWTDIRSASAVRVRDGYVLKLPRPLPLN